MKSKQLRVSLEMRQTCEKETQVQFFLGITKTIECLLQNAFDTVRFY